MPQETPVFHAIHDEAERSGRSLWVIGVDVDQYLTFEDRKSDPRFAHLPLAGWQDHTLTSIVKRLDVVVSKAVDNYLVNGEVGEVTLSIRDGGIDYVTTGGFVDDIVSSLEGAKQDIIDGSFILELQGVRDARHLLPLVDPLIDP